MAQKKHVDPVAILFPSFYKKHKWLYSFLIAVWLILGVSWFFYTRMAYPITSPFVPLEIRAQIFQGGMGCGKSRGAIATGSDEAYFSLYRDPKAYEEGFQYKGALYNEEIVYIPSQVPDRIFYVRDFPWEKMPSDNIIDYWIEGFKASEEHEFFSVCYCFASGAVLQVADLYEIYGKPADALHPHKYRVVRMFFVGTKYKKYFPHAYFETEANIQHYKQLMKEGKGWAQQANRYIDEKEVKKEKPVLDYRSNPDYYKPVNDRKTE